MSDPHTRVLVLGGTQFLGRHIVQQLRRAGLHVTIFHRGTTMCPLPEGVHECFGDRDAGFAGLDDRVWDAIIDVAAYRPEQMTHALELRARRGGAMLAPASAQRAAQVIDATDVARFAVRCIVDDIAGTYNVTGPHERASLETMLHACIDAARGFGAPASTIVWRDGAELAAAGVKEWSDLPLWIEHPQFAELRPLVETARAVMEWVRALDPLRKREAGLDPVRETELIA